MKKIILSKSFVYIIVVALMAVVFCTIYGVEVLNPTYTEWLLAGTDMSQHYIGWQSYRLSDWMFPIGNMDYLSYPYATSVIFTDSIPLFAVFFKLLSPILPEQFQYFGLWGIVCFMLQGVFTVKIISRFTDNKVVMCLMSVLMAFSPVFLWRMFIHTALAGHWILLMALDTVFGYREYKDGRKIYVIWGALAFLTATVHMYLMLMCGIILVGYCLLDILSTKKFAKSAWLLGIYLAVAAAVVGVLGGFSSSVAVSTEELLGVCSANLNTFFNAQDKSFFLRGLPIVSRSQMEGFAYVGLGFGIMALWAVFALANNKELRNRVLEKRNLLIVLAVISVIAFVFALSPTISLGGRVLFTIPLPQIIVDLWSVFRASGRVAWIVTYIIMFCAAAVICKYTNRKLAIIIFALCLWIQIYDLWHMLPFHSEDLSREAIAKDELLTDPIWDEIAANDSIKHLVFANAIKENEFEKIYNIADWALNNGLTTNDFYFARSMAEQVSEGIEAAFANPSFDNVFVFLKDYISLCFKYDLNYYMVGDYVIGYKGEFKEGTPFLTDRVHYQLAFGDNENLEVGFDDGVIRHIYEGGCSYGPYWYVPAGIYQVTIHGLNIDAADVKIISDENEKQYEYLTINLDKNSALLQFVAETEIDRLEIVVENNSESGIILNGIYLDEVGEVIPR